MSGFLKWGCGGSSSVLLCLCLCLSLVSFQSCGPQFSTLPGNGDNDPPPATCGNAGVDHPANPFRGWPQAGRDWADINYYYCSETYLREFGRNHWGIDIDAYFREPVYATAPATVAWAYYDTETGMGRTVKICHVTHWCAIYMHLDEWVVAAEQAVGPGTLLGYADSTGFSTGNHLHYQINDPEGRPVDPAPAMGSPARGGQ